MDLTVSPLKWVETNSSWCLLMRRAAFNGRVGTRSGLQFRQNAHPCETLRVLVPSWATSGESLSSNVEQFSRETRSTSRADLMLSPAHDLVLLSACRKAAIVGSKAGETMNGARHVLKNYLNLTFYRHGERRA